MQRGRHQQHVTLSGYSCFITHCVITGKKTINTFLKKQRTFFSLAFTLLNLFKFEPYSAEAVA